jgi:hypothetical protein
MLRGFTAAGKMAETYDLKFLFIFNVLQFFSGHLFEILLPRNCVRLLNHETLIFTYTLSIFENVRN